MEKTPVKSINYQLDLDPERKKILLFWAGREHRSVRQHVSYILEQAVDFYKQHHLEAPEQTFFQKILVQPTVSNQNQEP